MRLRPAFLAVAASLVLSRTSAADGEVSADVRMVPSSSGAFGAWLVAGPFRGRPSAIDPAALRPSLGATVGAPRDFAGSKGGPGARWTIASSSGGPIDLKASLGAAFGAVPSNSIGYASAIVHVDADVRALLLLSVDDGVRVFVDGQLVHTRDEARPLRADDDVVPLHLSAGDHVVVLELSQRDGAWAFRARITDESLAPIRGASLILPGTRGEDARTLAAKMASATLDRTFSASAEPPRYEPTLTVRYAEGAPRDVPLAVKARLSSSAPAAHDERSTFDVDVGAVPVGADGVSDMVVTLPAIPAPKEGSTLEATVASRTLSFSFSGRPKAEHAIARAEKALSTLDPGASWLSPGSIESLKFLKERLQDLVAHDDSDLEAQAAEASELEALAAAVERGVDPYEGRSGPMRRAIRSPRDGRFSEFGLYLPPGFQIRANRTYPLVVGLHGLNGRGMGMMRWLFGGEDPKRGPGWQDRHVGAVPPIDAIVVTPLARANAFYREIGEVDVLDVLDWARKTYPVDPTRISITGASMGGTGAASIPLHLPYVFSAAEPLCGYHSYQIRQDVRTHRLRPWETFLVEERSNALWADNGEHLPLWIVHGTKDLPERNSGVLIEAYEKLGFSVKHDHPELGHNVWEPTYRDLRGMKWLLGHRLDRHPTHVHFKTSRTRWGTSAWITVQALAGEASWGEVDARAPSKGTIVLTTRGVAELRLSRDENVVGQGAVNVTVDKQPLAYAEGEPLVLHRDADPKAPWSKGPLATQGVVKSGSVTGPIRDVFYEPILFVYGDTPDEIRVNETVARAFAKNHAGIEVSYPMMSDTEFFARGEALENDRALFLVGRKNRVRQALEQRFPSAFPIHVDASGVTLGAEKIDGKEVGAAFIRPNPARTDRYVVVVAGADTAGTLRALSLPDLIPDFVVWDASLAPSRGQVVLGPGAVRAGGFFNVDWSLPTSFADRR